MKKSEVRSPKMEVFRLRTSGIQPLNTSIRKFIPLALYDQLTTKYRNQSIFFVTYSLSLSVSDLEVLLK